MTRLTQREMLTLASRGLGKVDLWGRRGVTLLSMDESEAMACALVVLGLVATPPGAEAPELLIVETEKEVLK